MAEIHTLVTAKVLDRKSAIKLLEDTLEDAKKGEFAALAIALVTNDGGIDAAWSETANAPPLVGAVALLQRRLITAMDNGS